MSSGEAKHSTPFTPTQVQKLCTWFPAGPNGGDAHNFFPFFDKSMPRDQISDVASIIASHKIVPSLTRIEYSGLAGAKAGPPGCDALKFKYLWELPHAPVKITEAEYRACVEDFDARSRAGEKLNNFSTFGPLTVTTSWLHAASFLPHLAGINKGRLTSAQGFDAIRLGKARVSGCYLLPLGPNGVPMLTPEDRLAEQEIKQVFEEALANIYTASPDQVAYKTQLIAAACKKKTKFAVVGTPAGHLGLATKHYLIHMIKSLPFQPLKECHVELFADALMSAKFEAAHGGWGERFEGHGNKELTYLDLVSLGACETDEALAKGLLGVSMAALAQECYAPKHMSLQGFIESRPGKVYVLQDKVSLTKQEVSARDFDRDPSKFNGWEKVEEVTFSRLTAVYHLAVIPEELEQICKNMNAVKYRIMMEKMGLMPPIKQIPVDYFRKAQMIQAMIRKYLASRRLPMLKAFSKVHAKLMAVNALQVSFPGVGLYSKGIRKRHWKRYKRRLTVLVNRIGILIRGKKVSSAHSLVKTAMTLLRSSHTHFGEPKSETPGLSVSTVVDEIYRALHTLEYPFGSWVWARRKCAEHCACDALELLQLCKDPIFDPNQDKLCKPEISALECALREFLSRKTSQSEEKVTKAAQSLRDTNVFAIDNLLSYIKWICTRVNIRKRKLHSLKRSSKRAKESDSDYLSSSDE